MRRAPIHNSQQIFVDLRYDLFCLGSDSFSYHAYWDLLKYKQHLALDSEANFILSPAVKPQASAKIPQKKAPVTSLRYITKHFRYLKWRY